LPVSNLIIPIGVVVAERILYLPSLAVSIAAAYAWVALEQNGTRRARQLAAAAAAAVLVLFGGRAVLRNPEWKSTDTIFAALLRDHPERSEEHTSELQSRENLVCRLLLEKKKWKPATIS